MNRLCKVWNAPLNKKNKRYCNRSCMSKGMRENHLKICKVCYKSFPAVKTSRKVTCSPVCSSMNIREIFLQGLARRASDRAAELLPGNPLLGRFDTHVNAKEWGIKAPDGQVFRCRNLKNWLREHEDLLDGTVKQAFVGLSQIKRSMTGASKRNNRTWKGWTVIDWGE